MRTSRKRHGFTLVEIMVVIAITTLLAGMLFVVFAKAREKARQTVCLSNQRQIGMALLMAAQDRGEVLPDAGEWQEVVNAYGVTSKLWDCPSNSAQGTASAPDYAYNGAVAGRSLGSIHDERQTFLTADSRPTVSVAESADDLDDRHSGRLVASFADGHAALVLLDDL
ncbi:MAG: type II secretion system protein [Armatimonadota bacterium]